MKNLVYRPDYMRLLEEYRDTPQIKVLTGIRRCGKSSLLELFTDTLEQDGIPDSNILFLKCDSVQVPLDADCNWLEKHIVDFLENADPHQAIYCLFDEIQNIPEWERVIRRLQTDGNTNLYITGSNADLLSSDLATHLSGRYVELPVYPLSFSEYISFVSDLIGEQRPVDDEFDSYLRYGGMPGLFNIKNLDQEAITRELQAIHDTVILNDVTKRFAIRDVTLLEKLVRYVFSTSGNLFSTRSIVNTLRSGGQRVYSETIESYIDALSRAYLLYPIEQSGIQGKDILRPLRKFYAPDTGLRNLEIGFKRQDIGFQLESVVRMELARRGYSVSIGSPITGEIDFVASRNDEVLYIQVCQSFLDNKVVERETKPLLSVRDSFPKMILTTDRIGLGTTPEGIHIVNIIDWLLKKDPHTIS